MALINKIMKALFNNTPLDPAIGCKIIPKAYLLALTVTGIDSDRTIFGLFGSTTPIGRDRSVTELTFQERDKNSAISKLHCTILDDDDGTFSIRDEDSSNGTYLNGKMLEVLVPEALHEGDIIELGQVERGGIKFRFSLANSGNESNSLV
jgi:pSer/pThr/pTyr-binding forkhead associated (FHA) protein